jgi:glc operon protein GlcG
MTFDKAQDIVKRAIDKAAAEFKRPICVSVCDRYGFLVAFARMDGAPIRSVWIAQQKAFTAVRMGISTAAFLERLRKDNLEANWFGEGLVALPGGNVVKNSSGEVIGAVGISGLAAHEDQIIADAVIV